jgi:transcriptional regulator with XRE-family HTH domain
MSPRASAPSTDELRERFGANLRECRKRLGISQEEVSFRAETHATVISALELGERVPRIDTFIRVAGALEAAPGELTAGIIWTPAETVVVAGGFEVPGDPALAAEVAALKGVDPRRRRQANG